MTGMLAGPHTVYQIRIPGRCIVRIMNKKKYLEAMNLPNIATSIHKGLTLHCCHGWFCYDFNIHERAMIEKLFSVFIFKALLA